MNSQKRGGVATGEGTFTLLHSRQKRGWKGERWSQRHGRGRWRMSSRSLPIARDDVKRRADFQRLVDTFFPPKKPTKNGLLVCVVVSVYLVRPTCRSRDLLGETLFSIWRNHATASAICRKTPSRPQTSSCSYLSGDRRH
jgi:hypothetical protein